MVRNYRINNGAVEIEKYALVQYYFFCFQTEFIRTAQRTQRISKRFFAIHDDNV